MTGSEESQRVAALQRKIHERIGEWLTRNWKSVLSAIGGVIGGAVAMALFFGATVHASFQASSEAKDASAKLTANVAQLQATVNLLVTQQQLSAVVERVKGVEDDLRYARGWKPDPSLGKKLPHEREPPRKP